MWKPSLLVVSAAATLLSLVVGVFGLVYAYVLQNPAESEITFEIIGDTNVLDVRKPLQDLDILFRGQDVRDQNLNLRTITTNVVNSGGVNILHTHFDPVDKWGIRFENGEVVEARLTGASSEYLNSNVTLQRVDLNTVVFPNITFDSGDSFAIEVLLLHPKNVSPSISTVGKIAGIKEIEVLPRTLIDEEIGIIQELFPGSFLIQYARMFIYFLGFSLFFVATTYIMIQVRTFSDGRNVRRRKERILRTLAIRNSASDDMQDFLVAHYAYRGENGLKHLRELIRDADKIVWEKPPSKWFISGHNGNDGNAERPNELDSLSKLKVLTRGEADNAIIDPEFIELVDGLLSELDD